MFGTHPSSGKDWTVYFGTYTGTQSKGIYRSHFNTTTGALSRPELAVETRNPSFLAVHPNGKWLYAVAETSDAGKHGAVAAFQIDSKNGALSLLNRESTLGSGPCHLALDPKGKCLLAANYGSGSVAILPVTEEGRLMPGTLMQHEGSSVHPTRQTSPHAHQAVVSPGSKYALVCDLGLDRVVGYRLDVAAARLAPDPAAGATLEPGSGPRHLAFRPDKKFFYVINELNSTMAVFAWEAETGHGMPVQTIRTVPADFTAQNYCAEVVVHPNGKYVYGSNRGHDSIVAFASDPGTGRLETIGYARSGGKYPRFITLDPSGKWLLSLNQNSGNIVVLAVDPRTGGLTGPQAEIQLEKPVCAVFVK